MFAGVDLERLEETKRLLVTEADIHRNVLRLEAARWSSRVSQLKSLQQTLTSYRGLLLAAVGAAGLFAASRGRSVFRWVPIALSLWRTLRQFWR